MMNKATFGAIALSEHGDCVAWKRYPPEKRWQPSITISIPPAVDEGAFMPAESVVVSGIERLLALRAAIDEALRDEKTNGST